MSITNALVKWAALPPEKDRYGGWVIRYVPVEAVIIDMRTLR